MMRYFIAVAAGALMLAGCSTGDDQPAPTVTETVTTEATTTSEEPEEPVAPAEPVRRITGCQVGMGPIETTWSDGTVTGYSDYCQNVHDQALQAEIDANAVDCDGFTCRRPNGTSYPDPDRGAKGLGNGKWQSCLVYNNNDFEYCKATVFPDA